MLVDKSSELGQKFKKKKKRSFLQKQKRFARDGRFGRGTQLSADMYEYFLNIMKVINTNKEDEEEMSVLSSNVFKEIEGKEAEYCCNQLISRIVETLLPFSNDEEFSKFIEKFGENLRPIFCDTFGSHVLQQTVIVSFNKYQKSILEDSDSKLHLKFFDYIVKISNFLFNNLEDFIWDTYSNAVGRTVFNVLSGNPVKGEVKPNSNYEVKEEKNGKSLPGEFDSLIKKFAKRLVSWPQFNELCNQPINSSFIQGLLIASRKFDECNEIIERILKYYENCPLNLTNEENGPFVRLIEVVLNVADEGYFKRIYKLIFKKKLTELAISKNGNFAVQKILFNCNSKKIFGKIFAKLEPEMEEILKVGHSGVFLAIVKGCRRLEMLQGECMNMLMKTFHIKDTKDIVPLVSCLTPVENYNSENSNFTLHGILVVEELLNFKKPINVVNSILELSESKIVQLLSDVKGSHITDSFIKSTTIGEKSRDKLFKKLKGYYLLLATSKHGSRSLDAIWSVISLHQKVSLAEELKEKQSELCSDFYGRGFAKKIHLDNFRRNKEDWIKVHKTSSSAQKYFSDIIPRKRQKTS